VLAACFRGGYAQRMRSWINSRSNSVIPAIIVAIIRPCGVDRSKANPFIAMTDTRQVSSARCSCWTGSSCRDSDGRRPSN
jgi:hypothetical protein